MARSDFVYTQDCDPHRSRAAEILSRHPEVRELLGRKNPFTMVVILTAVGFQFWLAWQLRAASPGQIFLAAYLVGAYASHTLFVCIHEAGHNLIFRTTRANLAAALLANLPSLVPTALAFRLYHAKHHSYLGIEDQDADLPGRWEARLIGSYSPGKLFWLAAFPVFQTLRTLRVRDPQEFSRRIQLNWTLQALTCLVTYLAMGHLAILYLLLSFWFSVGPHPLGARWIQEHWLVLDDHQETYSYYGSLNWLNLNVGYHNEHHDFPSVPWNLLPEVKRRAPEYYEALNHHTSMIALFCRFLFDQEISLFSRMVRLRTTATHQCPAQKT